MVHGFQVVLWLGIDLGFAIGAGLSHRYTKKTKQKVKGTWVLGGSQ